MSICHNEEHLGGPHPEAVATISLNALVGEPGYTGYRVCTLHLIRYVQAIFVDQKNDLRLAFSVSPA